MPRSPWLMTVWGPGVMRLFAGAALVVLGIAMLLSGVVDREPARAALGALALVAGVPLAAWGFRRSRLTRYFHRRS